MSKVVGFGMALVVSTLPAMETPESQTPQGWVLEATETPASLDLGSSSSSSAQTGDLPRVLSQESLASAAVQTATTPAAQSTSWWPSWLSWSRPTVASADSTVVTPSSATPSFESQEENQSMVEPRSLRSMPLDEDQFPALPVRQKSAHSPVSSQIAFGQASGNPAEEESWAQRVSKPEIQVLARLVVADRSESSPLPGADSPVSMLLGCDPLSQSTGDISCQERQKPQKRARQRARKKKEEDFRYQKLVEQE